MTTVLVLLAHADPAVRSKYEAACSKLGAKVHVIPFVAPGTGMSSLYDNLGAQLRAANGGRVLAPLVKKYAPGIAYDHLVLAWFSGGYAMGRQVPIAEHDMLAGMVAIDGMHTSFDTDHTASDKGLEWATTFAARARNGGAVFWVGHTDVQTPQTGPGAYASTTQAAQELVRIAGAPTKGLRVQAFDLRGPTEQKREHGDALHVWGPEWLAGAVAEILERDTAHSPPFTEPPPLLSTNSLGRLALEVALAEFDAHVREEPPGSNSGPRIREYLSGCERDGRPVSIPAGDWCAAAITWCLMMAARAAGIASPILRRLAVREATADGITAGLWRPKATGHVPQPGDLSVYTRVTGESPLTGGRGHINIVERVIDAATYVTIDPNAGVAWARKTRRFDDPSLLGWIATSQIGRPCAVSSKALAVAATLRTKADEAADWVGELLG